MKNFKKRLIGYVILFLIAIPVFIIGGKLFLVVSSLLAVLAYKELVFLDKYPKIPIIIGLIAILSMIIIYNNLSYVLLSSLLIPIIFYKDYDSSKAFKLMGISLLLGVAFSSFNTYMVVNKQILLYLIILTVANDTFAYLIGCMFGKHKFSKISPNKTIEGLIGGITFGFVFGLIYYLVFINSNVNVLFLIFITLILNISAVVGDIVFSKIKREYNIKDYSKLIPGHGGILDRLDSLIIVCIVYSILVLI